MRLIPAIRATSAEEYKYKLRVAETLGDRAQVDFMDGEFGHMVTIPPEDVAPVSTKLVLEAHLMVNDPIPYIRALDSTAFRRIYFHYEAAPDPFEAVKLIKELKMEAGVALIPSTELGVVADLLREVDAVLFVAVDPRYAYAPFNLQVLPRITQLKEAHPDIECGIDGGITTVNLNLVVGAGPDAIYIGSAIFDSPRPADAFASLQKQIFIARTGENPDELKRGGYMGAL